MHNSFNVKKIDEALFEAKSHNFPKIFGNGTTAQEAISSMNHAIIYYKDNNPKEYLENVKSRIRLGLECACGEILNTNDRIVGIAG